MGKTFTICTAAMQGMMKYCGEDVLRYHIEYPVFHPNCPAARKINRYYKTLALQACRNVRGELYAPAVGQCRYAARHGISMPVYEAHTEFQTTYLAGCVASLRFDRYQFTGGAHGNTLRCTRTWNLPAACPLRLEQLTMGNDPKQVFLDGIQAQIACRPQDYFDNASLLAARQFDSRRFYCTPQGVVLYYQQYEIAPYSSGIPEFFFPYSEGILEPCQLFCEA